MALPQGRAADLQGLAKDRLGRSVVRLTRVHPPKVAKCGREDRVTFAQGCTVNFQSLAKQWLGCPVIAQR
jgi:hypothetical protein